MITDHKLLPDIMKYLYQKKVSASTEAPAKVQVYANEEEKQRMKKCHSRCLKIMKDFLQDCGPHNYDRALDVACGDGRLTKTMLIDYFDITDLFDRDSDAVKLAKNDLQKTNWIGEAISSNMEDYQWKHRYNAIFMIWCIGYLDEPKLITFLMKAKSALIASN